MKRAAATLMLMLAAVASAAVDVRAPEARKTQWAPTRNSWALNARVAFAPESRAAASPYAGEAVATAAGSGVFLSRDPVGVFGRLQQPNELNAYAYASMNPMRYVDPDGRCSEDTQGAVACVQEDASNAWSAVKAAWNWTFPDSDAPTAPDAPRPIEVAPNSGVALVDFDAPSRQRMRFQQKWYRSLEQPTGPGGMSVMLNNDEAAALKQRRNVEGTLHGGKVAAESALYLANEALKYEAPIALVKSGVKVVVEASERAIATAPERLVTRTVAAEGEAATRAMNGLRASRFNPVTVEQQEVLRREFLEVGGDPSMLKFNQGGRTGFLVTKEGESVIQVTGDVFPSVSGLHPRSTMSTRAVLGHERGHSMFPNTQLPIGAWNDEFRASYWAAKNAPGLSFGERADLIRDAILRAEEAGVSIKPNPLMKYFTSGGYSPAPTWWKPPPGALP